MALIEEPKVEAPQNLTAKEQLDLKNKKLDTLYFVDNKLEYIQAFKSKGAKKVTGYILEITKELRVDKKYDERKVYFTLNFTVK